MTTRPFGLSQEELRRQDRWLRQLVRGLVGEADVEDVVQETWTSALRRRAPIARPRAWLSEVARNFARRTARSIGRRAAREAAVARPEAVPSTAQALELLELQERVVQAVRELREPYREALLLRYTLGLSVSEIARRTAAREPAVRQRLKRGLDLVRARLDGQLGPDWSGLPALVLWLLPGVLPMKKSTLLLVSGAALLGLVGASAWLRPAPEAAPELVQRSDTLAELEQAVALPDPIDPMREVVLPVVDEGPSRPTLLEVSGRVVDVRGMGLGGVGVAPTASWFRQIGAEGIERAPAQASTDAQGSFCFSTSDEQAKRLSTDERHVPVAFRWRDEVQDEALLVVAPAIALAGAVVDREGNPLADVQLTPIGIELRDYPAALDSLMAIEWLASSTDAEGRFQRRDLPAGLGRLRFSKEGYRSLELEIGLADDPFVAVTLERDEWTWTLRGVVRSPGGTPLEGVRVGFGERIVETDSDGRYQHRLPAGSPPQSHLDLWAAQPPWRTLVLRGFGRQLLESKAETLEQDLVFEGETLAIAGRVVDGEGEPVAGILLYPWRRPELSGGASPEDLGAPSERETLDLGQSMRVWTRSEPDGSFRLEGLLEDEYLLRLFDRERFAGWTSEEIRAGSEGVLLQLPGDFVRASVTGRVLDAQGKGMANVTLSPQLPVRMTQRSMRSEGNGRQFTTDAEGAFELTDVSGESLLLSLYGDSIMPKSEYLTAEGPVDGLEFVVERRCYFRLVLSGAAQGAKGFEIHDASGQALQVAALGGGEYSWSTWRSIEVGRTRTLAVGESAATLVLFDDQHVEIARLPLDLHGEGVHEIRW